MKQSGLILALVTLLGSCVNQSTDFEYEMKGIEHALHFYPDSTFVEAQHWADTSAIYSGQWYGVLEEGETIQLIANRIGLELLKKKQRTSYVIKNGNLELIEP